MNHTPELLEGTIANDYREILASTASLDAAAKKKGGKPGSTHKTCKCDTSPQKCCKSGATCTGTPVSAGKHCKKTDAFEHWVPGWSSPPASPSA